MVDPVARDGRFDTAEQEFVDFIYLVSHDLAASVRHVAAFSALLLEELGVASAERQPAYANRVQSSAARCHAMIEQLLVYSRLQRTPLVLASQDATQLMRRSLLRFNSEVLELGARVSISPLGRVDADPELLSVAFQHLLDNAIKFRRADVAPRIQVRSIATPTAWTLRVSDNGVGVAPELREGAFSMFRRLHPEDAYPGVGAGLSICRHIARRHGGEVRFVDQRVGACIEMTLPQEDGGARPGQT